MCIQNFVVSGVRVESKNHYYYNVFPFILNRAFPSLGMFVCGMGRFPSRTFPQAPLPPSWEYLKVLTPTEIRGCGGYQQHTMTLAS